ncbi:hypothetical protein GY25_02300 [Pedobacter himalayensis]|nr:hypothetical protein GY25_02300 [Pedobacter himalayensis]
MRALTKEWLQQTIAELEEECDAMPGAVNEDAAKALAAMKIALASLEAEPVAWTDADELRDVKNGGSGYLFDIGGEANKFADPRRQVMLYTIPPAPVSVPDELTREEYKRRFMEEDNFDDTFRGGWNACRAAMLQGADGNAPAHFRSRPAQSSLSPAQGGNSPVIPDGWVMVPIEPTAEMISSGIAAHFERSQTQIHDRPAPGPMECAYVAMLAAAPQQEVK